jgi:hypothetical protein
MALNPYHLGFDFYFGMEKKQRKENNFSPADVRNQM